MFSCDHLSHPFLNDPGTSQDQRLPAALTDESAPIDGRKMADLLNYFAALSHQINFYDQNLNVSDWGPFFSGDLPFTLSDMAEKDTDAVKTNIDSYTRQFMRQPSPEGLQLIFLYTWFGAIYPIQQMAALLDNSEFPLEQTLQTLIKNRLTSPVKSFISLMNTAVRCFCIRPLDMSGLLENEAWGLTAADLTLYDENFSCTLRSRRSQMLALQASLSGIVDYFTEVVTLAGAGAANLVNKDLTALLQVSGQQDTKPHLALLYSFLTQFLSVLKDLNKLTGCQLNFFFQQVLRLSPGSVVPDKAFIIFTLQKQLSSYTLPAGLSLKDGKDSLQADILFALDAPLTITQTQAVDFRTLFLNNKTTGTQAWLEGVYMAPDATKSDGISQPFTDPATASWPTLGAKVSEYTPPRAAGPVDYPSARLGFILASKILLMNEGTRMVHTRLACQWVSQCEDTGVPDIGLSEGLAERFASRYLVITQAVIDQAAAKGLRSATADALRDYYLLDPCHRPVCAGEDPVYRKQAVIPVRQQLWTGREAILFAAEKYRGFLPVEKRLESISAAMYREFLRAELSRCFPMESYEMELLEELLVPQTVLTQQFSGPKAWLVPDVQWADIEIVDADNGYFMLNLYAIIDTGRDAVTFYDKAKLGEDFGTTDPLVKVLLNDSLKLPAHELQRQPTPECCLSRPVDTCGAHFSFYAFFRNVIVLDSIPEADPLKLREADIPGYRTRIHITVCGVKNLVVQSDDNLLNPKKAFTPFGVKPNVPDFNVRSNNPLPWTIPPGTRPPVLNLVGPNFYVGSTEVFLKKWKRINVNLNWLSKPADLRNYYLAYFHHLNIWPKKYFAKYEVNLSIRHDGTWYPENGSGPHVEQNDITGDYNRHFFADREDRIDPASKIDYAYSFDLRPVDFGLEKDLAYDASFAPLTSYSGTVLNGFLRFTMENQDFMHKIYTTVMAEKIIARAHDRKVLMPNEPWTPTIVDMAIDYEAVAHIPDMQLIQLYPYDGTYKDVDMAGEPTLFATFCDEGTLFIGLSGLTPGDGLSMLVQLADATGDTEGSPVAVSWYYLASGEWQALRTGFEIIQDNTNNLSTTGIIQFSFPDDISNDNTILPAPLYWIKASVAGNSAAVSETMALLTQAGLATFANNTKLNDQTRPGNPLAAGSITKLTTPDASVSGVSQPYASFGGHAPEISGNAYRLRVSEQLRHRGRAIQKWDYERMVLQQFPQILRAKCINHSYALSSHEFKKDFPMAPGSVVLAVLPDTTKLAVADSLQPTVPMSMLTAIGDMLTADASPFIKLFVCNPRYDPVDICLTVNLQPGKDSTFYKAQLQQDIRGFMAPWLGGNPALFQFAQRLYRSDLVEFVESRDYIANVSGLNICFQGEKMQAVPPDYIDPLTPRSILTAGTIVVNIPMAAGKPVAGNSSMNNKKNRVGNGSR